MSIFDKFKTILVTDTEQDEAVFTIKPLPQPSKEFTDHAIGLFEPVGAEFTDGDIVDLPDTINFRGVVYTLQVAATSVSYMSDSGSYSWSGEMTSDAVKQARNWLREMRVK